MDEAYVERVLAAIECVPPGRVTSYGDLAALLGDGGPRRVALVLSRYGSGVAWWRVVRTDGTAAEPVRADALSRLRDEGVPLMQHRVDMREARLTPTEWARLRPDRGDLR